MDARGSWFVAASPEARRGSTASGRRKEAAGGAALEPASAALSAALWGRPAFGWSACRCARRSRGASEEEEEEQKEKGGGGGGGSASGDWPEVSDRAVAYASLTRRAGARDRRITSPSLWTSPCRPLPPFLLFPLQPAALSRRQPRPSRRRQPPWALCSSSTVRREKRFLSLFSTRAKQTRKSRSRRAAGPTGAAEGRPSCRSRARTSPRSWRAAATSASFASRRLARRRRCGRARTASWCCTWPA